MSLAVATVSTAQTTLISPTGNGGFETGATFAANGWTVVNGAPANRWVVNNAPPGLTGTRCAYLTNNDAGAPPPFAYNISASTVHFYRDVTFPSGETTINFSFAARMGGETGWHRLLVYISNTAGEAAPVAGNPVANGTALTGYTLLYTGTPNAAFTTIPVTITGAQAGNAAANSTRRILFTWQNDSFGGGQPGVAVDNISLTSQAVAVVDPCTTTTAAAACGTANTTILNGNSAFWANQSLCGITRNGSERIYTYTPPTTGVYTINVSSTAMNNFTALVWATSCAQLATWNCIDDHGSAETGTYSIGSTWNAGTTYYIMWKGETATTAGTVNWTINCFVPPAVNPCTVTTTAAACGVANNTTLTAGAAFWANQVLCGVTRTGAERIYTYVPPVTGSYQITVGSTAMNNWTALVWATSCAELATWNCIDDHSLAETGTYSVGSTWTAGTTYYIMWKGETNTTSGTVNWTINCVPLVDPCATSTVAAACGSPNNTTIAAGDANWPAQILCSITRNGNEKVYSYVPPVTGPYTITINTNSINDWHALTYNASPCQQAGPWSCIADLAAGQTGTLATTLPLTAGTTYYFLWKIETNTGSGTVNWTINCAPPPPDPCDFVVPLAACGSTQTSNHSGDGVWDLVTCDAFTVTGGEEKVYSYTPPWSGSYTFSVTAISGGYADFYYKPQSAGCGPNDWLCIGLTPFAPYTSAGVLLTGGTAYYILVDAEQDATSVTFGLDCAPPPCELAFSTPGSVDDHGCNTFFDVIVQVDANFSPVDLEVVVNGGAPTTISNIPTGAPFSLSSVGGPTYQFDYDDNVQVTAIDAAAGCELDLGTYYSNCPITLDCGTTLTVNHCYQNNDPRTFTYLAEPGQTVTLTFVAGTMDAGDVIAGYSGTDDSGGALAVPGSLTGNFPDLIGASGTSTGTALFLEITDDGDGGSCQDGDQDPWVFEVECTPSCTDATAAVTDPSTCATYSFVVEVDILDLGTGLGGAPETEVNVQYTVNSGTPITVGPFTSTGSISPALGPFTIGDDVDVVLLHGSNDQCDHSYLNFDGDLSCPTPGGTCALPIVVPVNANANCPANAVIGDNSTATQDGPNPTCDGGGPWPDVWYRFNSGSNTVVNIDMTNIDMGDMVVDVFTGTCGALSPVPGACGFGGPDFLGLAVTASTNYWVRVSNNMGFGDGGQHSICVSQPPPPPANDLCANAQALTVGPLGSCPAGQVPGSTSGATSDGAPVPSCLFGTTQDVSYSFNSGTNTGVVFNLTLGTMLSSGVQLLTACGGTELACFSNQLTGTFAVTPGTDYIVRVHSSAFAAGTFNICLSAAPPPPANDACANAAPLTVQTFGDCMTAATTGTTVNATFDGPAPTCDPMMPNVWYSFNSGPNTTILSTLEQGAVDPATDLAIDYVNGACPGTSTFQCGFGPPFSLSYDNVPVTVTPFTEYHVRIWTNSGFGDQGTFSLCLQSPPAPECNTGYSAPADGSSTCSDGSVAVLSWPAVPNAGVYDVYFDNAGGTTLVSPNHVGTTYATSPLVAGTYSWRVVPKNGSGAATGPCPTWSFTRTPTPVWYRDTDAGGADGFGDPNESLTQCTQPVGYVANNTDNCPLVFNPGQQDGDGDGDGDACDNCVSTANADQANADGDAIGDVCDACPFDPNNDIDGDGICGDVDNCPTVFGQIGNTCDANPSPSAFTLGELSNSCVCVAVTCTQNLTIELQTDANPGQITWELREQGTNQPIQSGTPVAPNGIQTMNTCVPNGCYYLRVTDSGGDGIVNGGYILRTAGSPGTRLIDNRRNFGNLPGGPPDVSQIANGEGFCVPIGTSTQPIYTSCDKLDWVTGQYLVCSASPAVSALWDAGNTAAEAISGYEFQIFNPNGGYIFNRFRAHNVSDGFAPDNATRACHMKINNWAAANQIPANVLMNVRIRTRINGVNGNWGAACRFKIDPVRAACPLTKLTDIPGEQYYSCGTTRAWGSGNYVYARPVSGATQYQWRFRIDGESFISIRTTTTYFIQLNWPTLPLQNGKTYQVEVRAFKGGAWCIDSPTPANCGFVTPCFVQWGDVCLLTIDNTPMNGGENFTADEGPALRMYPNPNRGDQLYLSLDAVQEGVQTVSVDITDMFGKRVSARTIPVTDSFVNTVLDLDGDMANGMYMVNITAGDQRHTERLVIQR